MATRGAPFVAVEFGRRLRDRFGPRVHQVKVFGSYARGAAHEASDVDVLVVLDELSREEKLEVIDLSVDVTLGQALSLSPLIWSAAELERLRKLELGLVANIDREGVAV